jgi:hypothetical protein
MTIAHTVLSLLVLATVALALAVDIAAVVG